VPDVHPRRIEVELRHEIGVDTFMFGADFPHSESTWPNTLSWLQSTFYDVPEDELRLMLGENAIKLYGLDQGMLSKITAKIGHAPSDIMGVHKVDERLIADFAMRANFTRRCRRSAMIWSTTSGDVGLRNRRGLEDRSSRPPGPSARNRLTHLPTVFTVVENAAATVADASPASTRRTISPRPVGVSRAFLCTSTRLSSEH
jgi:hypothetical protein